MEIIIAELPQFTPKLTQNQHLARSGLQDIELARLCQVV